MSGEWQPIETVPLNTEVLVFINWPTGSSMGVDEIGGDGEWMIADDGEYLTHWMPLPEPPK